MIEREERAASPHELEASERPRARRGGADLRRPVVWSLAGATFLAATTFLALMSTSCTPTTGGIHARMGYSESGGLRVVEVPEGPAERAGLREGDRITAIDGDPVRSLALEEVVERLRGEVGSEVEIEVVRDGELVTLVIVRAPYDR
jgi:C-terminal processing protease CtpA/Prc